MMLRKTAVAGLGLGALVLAGCSGGAKPFAEAVDHKIVGIEPGAGIMINTEKAMEAYGLGDAGWDLQSSSSAAMMAAMRDAADERKPVVVTLWEPHAVFSMMDVRKLDDPQHIYNNPDKTRAFLEQHAPEWATQELQSDVIATVTHKGLKDEAPAAWAVLQNFNVPSQTQSDWIHAYSVEDQEAEDIARAWVDEHADEVAAWKAEGADMGKSDIVIGIPPWPGSTVKSRVLQTVLNDMGYTATVKEMDIGVVYTSLADRQIDVNVAGWLPSTHADYWEKYGDQFDVPGINVVQTWLGLAVPAFVDESIQSLEDLAGTPRS